MAERSEGFRSNAERQRRSGGIDAAGKQGEEETLAAKKVKFEEAYSPGHRGSIDEPSDDEAREGKRGIVISEPAQILSVLSGTANRAGARLAQTRIA